MGERFDGKHGLARAERPRSRARFHLTSFNQSMNPSKEIATGLPKDADQLITNISKLMDEAEEMLSESSSQHAEETVQLLRERDYEPNYPMAARYAATRAKLAGAGRHTDKVIRSYPYESVAMALGVGLLLGACFFRRSSSRLGRATLT